MRAIRPALVAALVGSLILFSGLTFWSLPRGDSSFEAFVAKYGKRYSDEHEYEMRKAVFESNVRRIAEVNARQSQYRLAVNEFADLTQPEFQVNKRMSVTTGQSYKQRLSGRGTPASRHVFSGAALPDAVDWSSKGAVTPVKNQGHCGSCYSFSATGALEGRYEVATGKLLSLSEQQIVDCSQPEGNSGCNGGLMDFVFEYVEQHGICSEEEYAYHADEESCKASKCKPMIPKGVVTGFKDVHEKDAHALMEALTEGPVAVAIEADEMTFQFYHSGVLSEQCGDNLDHGVLAVGYGQTEDGQLFWKVKNSWGEAWGDHGYIYLDRKLEGPGECGILLSASYPVIAKDADNVFRMQQ